jgi:hypothetical protein
LRKKELPGVFGRKVTRAGGMKDWKARVGAQRTGSIKYCPRYDSTSFPLSPPPSKREGEKKTSRRRKRPKRREKKTGKENLIKNR